MEPRVNARAGDRGRGMGVSTGGRRGIDLAAPAEWEGRSGRKKSQDRRKARRQRSRDDRRVSGGGVCRRPSPFLM